jgi:hypothetical protein
MLKKKGRKPAVLPLRFKSLSDFVSVLWEGRSSSTWINTAPEIVI